MRLINRLPAIVCAFALGLAVAGAQERGTPRTFEVDPAPLEIATANGVARFDVEVADTSEERADGLMFRTDFPQDRAMLFVFEQPRLVTMWMKNTPLPLDMVFVGEDGAVASIAESTTPFSTDIVSSEFPVGYTIELNAGTVDRAGIAVGDKVTHPAIGR